MVASGTQDKSAAKRVRGHVLVIFVVIEVQSNEYFDIHAEFIDQINIISAHPD